jgi:predicted phosphodiesterase
MVKIQIVSDIHLEFRDNKFNSLIIPSAPILCLLGDIGVCGSDSDFESLKKFIIFYRTKFLYIFYVPGNHEYYTTGNKNIQLRDTIPYIDNKIRRFCALLNKTPEKDAGTVTFLNNDMATITIGKKIYNFVGTTLWSYVNKENKKSIQSRMNDYSQIYTPCSKTEKSTLNNCVRKFNVDDMQKKFNKSVSFIKKCMKNQKNNEMYILLTHHKPIHDNKSTDVITQAYESDLVDIIVKHPFVLAAHGHTHKQYDKTFNKVRVVSNPKGYVGQQTKFNDTFVVSIP